MEPMTRVHTGLVYAAVICFGSSGPFADCGGWAQPSSANAPRGQAPKSPT